MLHFCKQSVIRVIYFLFFFCSGSCALDLDTALAEAKIAVDLFFNNKFNEAEALMKPL